ncbi:unnamed protein product, partial [Brenthis ino]
MDGIDNLNTGRASTTSEAKVTQTEEKEKEKENEKEKVEVKIGLREKFLQYFKSSFHKPTGKDINLKTILQC